MRDDGGRGNEPGEGGHGQDAAGFEDATSGRRGVPPDEVLAHEHALPEQGERDFEPDVERLHRAIYREPRDPIEGREPLISTRYLGNWLGTAVAAITLAVILGLDAVRQVVLAGDLNLIGPVPARVFGAARLVSEPSYPATAPRVQFDHLLGPAGLDPQRPGARQLALGDHRLVTVTVHP